MSFHYTTQSLNIFINYIDNLYNNSLGMFVIKAYICNVA